MIMPTFTNDALVIAMWQVHAFSPLYTVFNPLAQFGIRVSFTWAVFLPALPMSKKWGPSRICGTGPRRRKAQVDSRMQNFKHGYEHAHSMRSNSSLSILLHRPPWYLPPWKPPSSPVQLHNRSRSSPRRVCVVPVWSTSLIPSSPVSSSACP